MQSFKRPTKRIVLVSGITGAALIGALSVGGAAFADGPGPSASTGTTAPSGAPSAPTPPAANGQSGSSGQSQQQAPAAPQGGPGAQGGPAAGPAGGPGKHQPHIGGEVQSVSGSTVTVKDPEGFTRTIALADGVKIEKDGASASSSAITKGQHIDAEGTVASNGTTLNATTVHVGQPAGPKGGPGAGGPGKSGHGPAAPAPSTGSGSTSGSTSGGATPATPPSGAPSAPAAPSTAPSQAPQGS